FEDAKNVRVDRQGENAVRIKFKHCIIATGSRPVKLEKLFKNPKDMQSKRILDSTSALALEDIPDKVLAVGGRYIGLEMGTVYAALGSEVTVVEMTDGLLPGVDRDLVKPLATHLAGVLKNIHLSSRVTKLEDVGDGIEVT